MGAHTYDDDVTDASTASPTVPNLRDLGGLSARDGGTVVPGRLLRSGLPHATDVVPAHIEWPPSVVVDLRSPVEHGGDHPLAPLNPRVVNLPLLHSLAPGWFTDSTLADLYAVVVDDSADLLVRLVQEVASADGATLVHCAAGKDRTGVGVALVLSLLGVDVEAIEADYLRTAEALEAIDARLRPPGTSPGYGINPVFHTVDVDALRVAIARWHGHRGGPTGWFLDAGGERGDLQRLESALLT